jgi:hypothetical protein
LTLVLVAGVPDTTAELVLPSPQSTVAVTAPVE